MICKSIKSSNRRPCAYCFLFFTWNAVVDRTNKAVAVAQTRHEDVVFKGIYFFGAVVHVRLPLSYLILLWICPENRITRIVELFIWHLWCPYTSVTFCMGFCCVFWALQIRRGEILELILLSSLADHRSHGSCHSSSHIERQNSDSLLNKLSSTATHAYAYHVQLVHFAALSTERDYGDILRKETYVCLPGDMKNVFFSFFSAFSKSSDVMFTIRPTVGTARRNPSTLKRNIVPLSA